MWKLASSKNTVAHWRQLQDSVPKFLKEPKYAVMLSQHNFDNPPSPNHASPSTAPPERSRSKIVRGSWFVPAAPYHQPSFVRAAREYRLQQSSPGSAQSAPIPRLTRFSLRTLLYLAISLHRHQPVSLLNSNSTHPGTFTHWIRLTIIHSHLLRRLSVVRHEWVVLHEETIPSKNAVMNDTCIPLELNGGNFICVIHSTFGGTHGTTYMGCIIFTRFHSIWTWERSFLAYLHVGLFIFDKLRLYKLGSHARK